MTRYCVYFKEALHSEFEDQLGYSFSKPVFSLK